MKYKRFITYVIVIVIFFFIGKVLIQNWKQIPFENLQFKYLFLIYSFIAMIITLLLCAIGWKQCIRCFGEEVSFLKANQILALSRAGAYVPGKIWGVLGLVYFAKQEGISGAKIGANVVLETIICLLSGILIAFVSLAFVPLQCIGKFNLFLLLSFIPVCLALYPPFFRNIVNLGLKILKQEPIDFTLSYFQLLLLLVIYSVNWFFQGLCFYFLIKSFYQIPVSMLSVAITSHIISWFVGFISFFSPGGLGIKEGIMSFILKSYLPVSIGITSAILFRIWGLIGMLIFAVIFGRKYITVHSK